MGLGNTPFGIGTPVLAADPANQRDQKFSRYLNPNSGDYEIDPDTGGIAQMPAVRQRVLIIMKTIRGSSTSLPGLGIRLPPKIDETFELAVKNGIREAFSIMTDIEKSLSIDGMQIKRLSSGRIRVIFAYTDLTQPGAAPEPLEILF